MLARLTTSILLSAAALTACGDDGNKAVDAAVAVDSGPGGVDACVGHTCGTPGAAVTDPEGGNLILEHMNLDAELSTAFQLPTGVTTQTRVIAYFMSAQTPNANPLPTPGVCNNLVTTKGWPFYVGTPHTDVDVGTLKIKGKNAAGLDVTMDIPKKAAGTDQIGRAHDIYYQFLQPKVDDLLKSDSFYSVEFGGVTGGMPATTFPNAVYLAAAYTGVSAPTLDSNGPVTVGTDFTVKWTAGTSTNKPSTLVGGDVLGGIWLLDATGAPTHVCVVPSSAGTFTIPGATLTEWKAIAMARSQPTNKMIILRNGISHQVVRLPTTDSANQRRIDMVSLECWAQVMDVQ